MDRPSVDAPSVEAPIFEFNSPPISHASSRPSRVRHLSTSSHPMVTRKQRGITKPVQRLNLHVDSSPIPRSYLQSFQDPHWLKAMLEEFYVLILNKTWVLVPKPANANVTNCIWLFKNKLNADGSLSRYKARMVANGRA